MSLSHEQVEFVETDDLPGVQSFYARVGYAGGAQPSDRLLVASVDQSIVAAVRLCPEGGTLVLRGMYVANDHQGCGIGSRLLESISTMIGASECWCIPFTHLKGFYSRIGFDVCEGPEIPLFISERWERYKANGQKVVIMKRQKI